MPGGPIIWWIVLWGAVIALVGSGGVWFAVWRFRRKGARSLGPIAGLLGVLVALFGLWVMIAELNPSGDLGR